MNKFPKLIVLLDDHPIASEGLKNICEETNWGCDVKTFTDPRQLFEFLQNNTPDILLIDIQLGEADGRDIIKQLKKSQVSSTLIALSSFDDPVVIRSTYASGADAYIIKNATSTELVEGLLSIWRGEKNFFQEKVRNAIEKVDCHIKNHHIKIPRLTTREKEVLQLITEEKTTSEIAKQLFLSSKTIESHRTNLFMKMEVKNSVGAVKKAMEWGLI